MIDYADYAELRRRAERRLTALPIWPVMLAQGLAYLLVLMRGPFDTLLPLLAMLWSSVLAGGLLLVYPRRTSANRNARRSAIDIALEDACDTGSPIADPTARELRLLALLLDEDLETRAGSSQVTALSAVVAAVFWIVTFWQASYYGMYAIHTSFALLPLFFVWLAIWGGLTFRHRLARRASDERVHAMLGWYVPREDKRKRVVEAPWWSDDEPVEMETEKPKRVALDHLLTDDGEWAEGDDSLAQGRAH